MIKPHYNILIATPANNFTPAYVKSLLKTIYILNKENISWNFLNATGSLIAMVREETICGSYFNDETVIEPCGGEFTYDKIIWIDSDIEWQVSDFFALYLSDKDIITGCYLMSDRNIPIYDRPRGDMMSEEMFLTIKEPFKIHGCGFGFIGIKSGVFEKMPRPWFGPVKIPNDDKNKNISPEFIIVGEDLSWCTKAISCGFDIWADPSIKVNHQKSMMIKW